MEDKRLICSEDRIFTLIQTCQLIYRNKFVRGSQGNASIRFEQDRILIKKSGKSLRNLNPSDFVFVDITGNVKGFGEPSIETPLHLAIYEIRREVNVVLHTHPLNVIEFSAIESPLELVHSKRNAEIVPFIKYMKPGSRELASAVSREMTYHDAAILGKHGLVTVGKNIADAYELIKIINMNAKIQNSELSKKLLRSMKNISSKQKHSEDELVRR